VIITTLLHRGTDLTQAQAEKTLFVALQLKPALIALALLALLCSLPCSGQTPPSTPETASASQQPPNQPASGSISGTVVDQSGAVVAGAQVALTRSTNEAQSPEAQSPHQEVLSDADGQFSFANVPPGAFLITIKSAGFATQTSSGVLQSGEIHTVLPIALAVADNVTDVQVNLSRVEVAEEQIKDEEKQRVLGFIPNFYVTYDPHPVPLTSRQKFELAWKTSVDPVTFAIVGGIAGVQQAQNAFSGYGQGAQGYADRFGSTYANLVTGTFIGSAILPSLLKQDPRYFYKGTGSVQSRSMYAIANAVICKGDNGRWQTNY
jgi:hypothetical protein